MRDLVYVAYDRKDEELAGRLHKHLHHYIRAGLRVFDRHQMLGGEVVPARVGEALAQTHLVVLLLSADLLASDEFLNQELLPLAQAFARQEVVLLSVVARDCDFQAVEPLGKVAPVFRTGELLTETRLVQLAQRIGDLRGVRKVALDLPLVPVSWLRPPGLYGLLGGAVLLLMILLLWLGYEALVCRALLIGLPARDLSFPVSAVAREGLGAVPVLLHAVLPGIPGGLGEERSLALVPLMLIGLAMGCARVRKGRFLGPLLLGAVGVLVPGALLLTNALRAHHALLLDGGDGNCSAAAMVREVCSWLYNGGEENHRRQEALAGLWALTTAFAGWLLWFAWRGQEARPWLRRTVLGGLGLAFLWLLVLAPWAVALATFRNDFPRVQSLPSACSVQLPAECIAWHVFGAAEPAVLVLDVNRCPGRDRILRLLPGCTPILGSSSRLLQGD